MFELKWEWEHAPGVAVASHAQTWCRLEMRIGGSPSTRVEDHLSRSFRDGIYIPLLPLAEWLVSCWWFLFHESPQHESIVGGRRAGEHERTWYARHNLLVAREGYALPDLTLVRADDDLMLLKQVSDPEDAGQYPVRFTSDLQALVPRRLVLEQFQSMLDAIAERLGEATDDGRAFNQQWRAVRSMSGEDRTLRERAAALGMDGDDPDEVDDSLAAALVYGFNDIPRALVPELLDGALPGDLESRALRVRALRGGARGEQDTGALSTARTVLTMGDGIGLSAESFRIGWELADRFRKRILKADAAVVSAELDQRIADLGIIDVWADAALPGDEAIRGWVGAQASGTAPVVVSRQGGGSPRFLSARALALALLGRRERLITDSVSHSQRVARAFAAELLAPVAYVQARVTRSTVTQEHLAAIAQDAAVHPLVVRHQIENHRLATLVE